MSELYVFQLSTYDMSAHTTWWNHWKLCNLAANEDQYTLDCPWFGSAGVRVWALEEPNRGAVLSVKRIFPEHRPNRTADSLIHTVLWLIINRCYAVTEGQYMHVVEISSYYSFNMCLTNQFICCVTWLKVRQRTEHDGNLQSESSYL